MDKTLVLEPLFNKTADLNPCKETSTQMFFWEYCEFFKNDFFAEHLRWLLL